MSNALCRAGRGSLEPHTPNPLTFAADHPKAAPEKRPLAPRVRNATDTALNRRGTMAGVLPIDLPDIRSGSRPKLSLGATFTVLALKLGIRRLDDSPVRK